MPSGACGRRRWPFVPLPCRWQLRPRLSGSSWRRAAGAGLAMGLTPSPAGQWRRRRWCTPQSVGGTTKSSRGCGSSLLWIFLFLTRCLSLLEVAGLDEESWAAEYCFLSLSAPFLYPEQQPSPEHEPAPQECRTSAPQGARPTTEPAARGPLGD